MIDIRRDDPTAPAPRALIDAHVAQMHAGTPAESVHAMAADSLRSSDIAFWSAWIDGDLAGIAALKRLDAQRAEIKSMRTADAHRGAGVGRALLRHLVGAAREWEFDSVWLETGADDFFIPARALYASEGFALCPPFEPYRPDPLSVFMTRPL